jgi:hypothetical protein
MELDSGSPTRRRGAAVKMFRFGTFAMTESQPSSPESTSRSPKTPSPQLMQTGMCMYRKLSPDLAVHGHWAMLIDGARRKRVPYRTFGGGAAPEIVWGFRFQA